MLGVPPALPSDLIAQIIPDPGGGGGGGGGGNPPPIIDKLDTGIYKYDGAGNIIAIGTDLFSYDELSRLTDAVVTNLPGGSSGQILSYAYDSYGNMIQRTRSSPGTLFTWTFDCPGNPVADCHENNQLQHVGIDYGGEPFMTNESWNFAYDAVGNMTDDGRNHYIFDPAGRLKEVRTIATGEALGEFDYDDRGYRFRKVEDRIETFYVRDLQGRVLSEFRRPEGSTNSPAWDRDYVYALGGAVALVKNDVPAAATGFEVTWADNAGSMDVQTEWIASPEVDVAGYRVYRKELGCTPDCNWVGLFPTNGYTSVLFGPGDEVYYGDNGLPASASEYYVVVVDTAGHISGDSRHLVADFNDPLYEYISWDTPALVAGDEAMEVRWTPPTGREDRIVGYKVYRQAPGESGLQLITPDLLLSPEYLDLGLTNGGTYSYAVLILNTRGLEPPLTDPNVVTQQGVPVDLVPPPPPASTQAFPGPLENEATLLWSPSYAPDLAGYSIYKRGTWDPATETYAWDFLKSVSASSTRTTVTEAGTYRVRGDDDDGNQSPDGPEVGASLWVGDSVATWWEITDNYNGPSDPFEILEWGWDRDGTPSPGPWGYRALLHDAQPSDYGQPVAFRAAAIRIEDISGSPQPSTCPSILVYRQDLSTSDWILLTEQPVYGDPNASCRILYFDTGVTALQHKYRIVGPQISTEITYNYHSSSDPSAVMGQYAYGAELVEEYAPGSGWNVWIADTGDWELGPRPRMSPVVLKWEKSYHPTVQGYRVWAFDDPTRSTGAGGALVAQIDDPTVTSFYDHDAPFGWPLVLHPGGWPDPSYCTPASAGSTWETPCSVIGEADYLARYVVQAIEDPNAPVVVPTIGTGNIWQHAVRAIRIADDDCPSPQDFCDNCPEGAVASGSECLFPNSWPEETHYLVNFVFADPNAVAPAYPGYENIVPGTPWQTTGGINGAGALGWEDSTGVYAGISPAGVTYARCQGGDNDGEVCDINQGTVFNPGCPPTTPGICRSPWGDGALDFLDNRLDYGHCIENDGTTTRRFKLQLLPSKNYYVEIAAGIRLGGTHPTISANGVSFWFDEDATAVTVPDSHTGDWTGDIRQKVVAADANGVVAIDIGGPGPGSTCINYVRVREERTQPSAGSNLLIPMLPAGHEYRIAGGSPGADSRGEKLESSEPILWALQYLGHKGAHRNAWVSHWNGQAPAPDRLVGTIPSHASVQWLHADHLGSTRMVTNEEGAVVSEHKFLPFGDELESVSSSAANAHKFTGHERDAATGMDYMLARFCHSESTFRFLRPDPLASSASPTDPRTWNRYVYVLNQPIDLVDRTGWYPTWHAAKRDRQKLPLPLRIMHWMQGLQDPQGVLDATMTTTRAGFVRQDLVGVPKQELRKGDTYKRYTEDGVEWHHYRDGFSNEWTFRFENGVLIIYLFNPGTRTPGTEQVDGWYAPPLCAPCGKRSFGQNKASAPTGNGFRGRTDDPTGISRPPGEIFDSR